MPTIPNLVTIDLDESRDAGARADVEVMTNGLLDALEGSKTQATFFVPRSVAESNPALTRKIADAGHELACLTITQPANERPYCASFASELSATKGAIEGATGVRVRGHRNATFAVKYESEWAYDVLVDHGFEYDSSRFPARYAEFGDQPIPASVHAVRRWGGMLLEVPVSTTDVLSMRMQVGTTGTLRGLPLPVIALMVAGRQKRGEPLVMHLKASELRRAPGMLTRSAAPTADRRTLHRVSGIVNRFPFTSVARALPDLLRAAPIIES
jgi:hypothetical protein